MLSGEFRKYRHELIVDNLNNYNSEIPPLYPLENIQGFKITLVCGKGDLLASKPDYDWLHELLKDSNEVRFMEFDEGHQGLIFPED